MKKRNSMLILALVAAVLLLGVGYAAISAVTLSISGSASAADSDLKVVFTGATDYDNSHADGSTVTATASGKSATISVNGLADVDDYVTVEYTIENQDDISATLATPTVVSGNNDYFSVSTSGITDGETLASGATKTITVTVQLIQRPQNATQDSTDITITLQASPVL